MNIATPARSEFRLGWPVVLSSMLGVALGLSPMPFYTIGIFAPYLVHDFHWNYAQIMTGIAVTTLGTLIASPLVGMASDRFGVRPVALTSVFLFGVCFMGLGLGTGSLPLYYVTFGIISLLGAGTLPITWTRAVNNAFQSSKGFALGLSLIGTGLFGYLIKPFAAWLITELGWRGAYVVIGALPILIALPAGLVWFRDPGQRRKTSDAAGALPEVVATVPGLTYRETLRQWRFWLMGSTILLVAFAVGGLIPNMENILRIGGFVKPDIVFLTSLIGLSVIAGRIAGGLLIDRFWAPGVAVLLLGAPAVACLMLSQPAIHYGTAAASICMIGIAAGVEYDLVAFLVARYFGMKSYSSIYGSLYGFYALGAGLGPVLFGANFDRTKTYTQSLYLGFGLFAGSALLLLLLGPYRIFGDAPPEPEVDASRVAA